MVAIDLYAMRDDVQISIENISFMKGLIDHAKEESLNELLYQKLEDTHGRLSKLRDILNKV